jgi:light-regulated signal transduction histidine kinase (bacteriophytochrome)
MEDLGRRLPAPNRKHLELLCGASAQMKEFIDGILYLSRVSAYEMQQNQTVDLSSIGREIGADLFRESPKRRAEIIIAPGLFVRGDPWLLRIAVEHMLRNAWKFTRRNARTRIELGVQKNGKSGKKGAGDNVRVGVDSRSRRRRNVYFVKDNGVGFDMEYAEKLFGPFQRLHKKDDFEGVGIGLATVQRIIHRHGGFVSAKGEIRRGATFCFALQPAKAESREARPLPSQRTT